MVDWWTSLINYKFLIKFLNFIKNLTVSNLDLAIAKSEFAVADNVNYQMALNASYSKKREDEYFLCNSNEKKICVSVKNAVHAVYLYRM